MGNNRIIEGMDIHEVAYRRLSQLRESEDTVEILLSALELCLIFAKGVKLAFRMDEDGVGVSLSDDILYIIEEAVTKAEKLK